MILTSVICKILVRLKCRTLNTGLQTFKTDRFCLKMLCLSPTKAVGLYSHRHFCAITSTSKRKPPTQSFGLVESLRTLSSQSNKAPFRDLELVVASNRVTAVANQALSLGSTKLKEAFYNGNIRLNGKRLTKKTTKVSLADTVDVILELRDDEVVLQRMLVLSEGEETLKGKNRYRVRCWKRLVLPRLPHS